MSIEEVAQIIVRHAQTGPGETPGQVSRNSLSPHYERLVSELIRSHVIKELQAVEKAVQRELDSLMGIMPEILVPQVELSAVRVIGFIKTVYTQKGN